MDTPEPTDGAETGKPLRGAYNQLVARAGEYFVVAELNKRKVYAVTFAGNMPKIDVIACNLDQSRVIHIQVKTKRSGSNNWHTSIREGKRGEPPMQPEAHYWIFVDLGEIGAPPQFWIVPDWWIRNDILVAHEAYLNRHGGVRAKNPDSTHHSIDENRLTDWKESWETLGVFD